MGGKQESADRPSVRRTRGSATEREDSRAFETTAPATPAHAMEMRQQFQRWLGDIGTSDDVVTDMQLAVYEALANVVEHAYPDGALLAPMWLTARIEGSDVLVTVSDVGRWREQEPQPYRGQGLELMRRLTTMQIATGSRGTTVTLRAPRTTSGS